MESPPATADADRAPAKQTATARIVVSLLFGALVLATLQQRFLPVVTALRAENRVHLADAADPRYPTYPEFLQQVRSVTKPGDRIALLFPVNAWEEGYAYGFYRASYFLSGREVLPLISDRNEVIAENAKRADYIAVFMRETDAEPAKIVFSSSEGSLLRK